LPSGEILVVGKYVVEWLIIQLSSGRSIYRKKGKGELNYTEKFHLKIRNKRMKISRISVSGIKFTEIPLPSKGILGWMDA
jgi:hypothetical protein